MTARAFLYVLAQLASGSNQCGLALIWSRINWRSTRHSLTMASEISQFWLMNFQVEIDGHAIGDYVQVLNTGSPVVESVAKILADQAQRQLYSDWKEVEPDQGEPCANKGTHRQTPWIVSPGRKATLCVYWRHVLAITSNVSEILRQAGCSSVKMS